MRMARSCARADRDSGGDITSVTAGNGIVGSASNGDVSLSINTSAIQKASGWRLCLGLPFVK